MRVSDAAGGVRYRSVRLMKPNSHKGFWPESAPYRIGDVWHLELEDTMNLQPPHVEDKLVRGGKLLRKLNSRELECRLLEIVPGMIPKFYWEGGPQELFAGKLRWSGAGKGHVTRANVTDTSTGFWVTDWELVLNYDARGKPVYRYNRGGPSHRGAVCLRYVGESEPVELIPRETLVRVSLARWWSAGDHPEACYLMMSGWY